MSGDPDMAGDSGFPLFAFFRLAQYLRETSHSSNSSGPNCERGAGQTQLLALASVHAGIERVHSNHTHPGPGILNMFLFVCISNCGVEWDRLSSLIINWSSTKSTSQGQTSLLDFTFPLKLVTLF